MSLRSEFETFKVEALNKFKTIDREIISCNSCTLNECRKRQRDELLLNERIMNF